MCPVLETLQSGGNQKFRIVHLIRDNWRGDAAAKVKCQTEGERNKGGLEVYRSWRTSPHLQIHLPVVVCSQSKCSFKLASSPASFPTFRCQFKRAQVLEQC